MKIVSLADVRRTLDSTLVVRFEMQFGRSITDMILKNFLLEKSPVIRINTLKTDAQQIMNKLRELNVRYERVPFLPNALIIGNRNEKFFEDLDIYKKGEIYFQGISSQLPALFLQPQPGEKILDMCAAPGSKTAQIGILMQNKGEILAMEKDQVRCERLKYNLEKQGITIAKAVMGDATFMVGEVSQSPEGVAMEFDRVLLDAPCSAEGRIDANDPRSHRFWSEKIVKEHAKLQRRLFKSGFKNLKSGGVLVYSTCTLAPEENEGVVEWALKEFAGQLILEKIDLDFKYKLPVTTTGTLKAMPSQISEGFFVAKFRKL
ncbi:MAG: RsmB/NOP family class I SAM-dependent RNA methyltransferase [Patescibacteria group bacterium]